MRVPHSKLGALASLIVAGCHNPPPTPKTPSPPPIVSATAPAPDPASPQPKAELGDFGIDLSARDTRVKPGDDFYRYVNGHWLATYELKPDEMRYGAFIKLVYRTEDQVKAILDELSRGKHAPGSIEQQVADYFGSYMDAPALEKKGIQALKPELDAIAAIHDRAGLIEAFGRAELVGTEAPLVGSVDVDRNDPDHYMLNIEHAGLGLPDRSYYLEDTFAKVRAAYLEHIATMLGFTGLGAADGKRAASAILTLETAMAKLHWPRAELRDVDKTRNIYTVAKFEASFPGYPWRAHFKAAGFDLEQLQQVNVTTPNAIQPLAKLVRDTPLATWKSYLTFHLVSEHAPLLGDTIDDANFAFEGKVLGGQQEQRARWKRGVEFVGAMHALGEGLGKLYVERYFPPASAAQMAALVGNLRAAFEARLRALDWMGPDTKREALEKLSTFNPKIGYPKKWRDFSSIHIVPGDLMANYRAVVKYWYDDEISRLHKPTDRDEWQITPQTINAYYNPAFNEIVFPAAILQPPFFDPHADPAVNYGGIGAVIGHEMGHGFDDQGSKSDARGVQRNWWTDADRKKFELRTAALVEQYGAYEPLPGQKLNGELTLGENIGDLGGMTIALDAYHRSLAGNAAPVLDGTTGDQRFFLAWGQVWASKQRDQFLLLRLKSDPHSPEQFRVNGVVRNMDGWYDAFGVKPGDALFLPPERRVHIW